MTAAAAPPAQAPRAADSPTGVVRSPEGAGVITGFGAIAWATGVEATAMKASLIDWRAVVSSRSTGPPPRCRRR